MVEVEWKRPGGTFQAQRAACRKLSGKKIAGKFQAVREGQYDQSREHRGGLT